MHASIICACLPSCRVLLVSLGATFLKSTRTGDSRYGDSKYGNSSKAYASKATTSRRGSAANVLASASAGGEGHLSPKPKHGDEGDFVPLVEYPNRNWDKQTVVSTSHSADADSR